MSYGYNPQWSEGAVKSPIFQTSTFVFRNAKEGKRFFEIAYGKGDPKTNEHLGLIYSRINNPNMQILEERLALLEGSEEAAAFESGMSAITTVMLSYLKPGDALRKIAAADHVHASIAVDVHRQVGEIVDVVVQKTHRPELVALPLLARQLFVPVLSVDDVDASVPVQIRQRRGFVGAEVQLVSPERNVFIAASPQRAGGQQN